MSIETYSLSSDFPGGLENNQLQTEINDDPGITPVCTHINTDGDVVDIYFDASLSAGEKTILDGIVASYTISPVDLNLASDGNINITTTTTNISINSGSGIIGIGEISAGDIEIGTSSIARTITMGNTTSTTALIFSAGTGGIAIGNDSNAGEIQIGNVSNAKTITLGNNTGASKLFSRWGTGGNIFSQGADTSLSDASATLTISQLLTQILRMTPTLNRTLTLPTAANVVGGISGAQVNDAFDFTIINENPVTLVNAFITIAMGSGGTLIGYSDVPSFTNLAGTFFTSGSATFRLRLTNVTASSEAYTIYRMV